MKKTIFLLLALILPLLVFIFLKLFGKNEFVVEPLFQTEESKLPINCPDVKTPYFINDSIYTTLKKEHEADSLLVIFYESSSRDISSSNAQLVRLQEYLQAGTGVKINRILDNKKSFECSLLLHAPLDLVLIDGKKRIRGQYNSTDRDEVDRLMTELDIILKKY